MFCACISNLFIFEFTIIIFSSFGYLRLVKEFFVYPRINHELLQEIVEIRIF